jgi:hypothetical protein
MADPGGDTRDLSQVPLNVMIPRTLKDRLEQYASDKGVSQAASTRILLSDALTASGYPQEGR